MPNAVNLQIPKLSYYGSDVPALGGSSDEILWDDGSVIQWDDFSSILWDNAAGVASSDKSFVFSYPLTQYEGSV